MALKSLLSWAGYIFFIIFTLFICISKAGVNIAGGVLFLLSIIYLALYAKEEKLFDHRYVLVLLFPLAIGLVLSLFSLNGPRGVVGFLERYRFFFLVLPFFAFLNTKKKLFVVFIILNVSAVTGVVYGYINTNHSHLWINFEGFHTLGRHSDLLVSVILMNISALLFCRFNKRFYHLLFVVLVGMNSILMLSAVILMARRGSYLGLVIGMFVLSFIYWRKWLLFLVIILTLSVFIIETPVSQRIKSIVDVNNDISNIIRIQLNKTGIDFVIKKKLFLRGTGGKQSEQWFREFYLSKSDEYRERFGKVEEYNYFGNFHNSFLQIAVEYGVVFLLTYLCCVGYLFVWILRNIKWLDDGENVYPVSAIVVTMGFYVSQMFHNDLYSYGGIPQILIFLSGCYSVGQFHRDKMTSLPSCKNHNCPSISNGFNRDCNDMLKGRIDPAV